MKSGKIKIVSGPNIQWYFVTVLFVVFGGWQGLLIWAAINIFFIGLAFFIDKRLRNMLCDIFFRKTM